MKTVNAKTNVVHAVALPAALELCAAQIAGALQETSSLSQTLGTLTIEAGKLVKKSPEMLDPFMDACRQMCGAVGLTEGSFKAYMTHIRSVVRAMLDGYKPKDGQSLRSMYENAPKGTGGKGGAGTHKKSGARPNDGVKANAGDDVDAEIESLAAPVTKAPSAADAKRAAMITLFGHADDELAAALAWAAEHELRFVNLIKGQIAFDAKPAKQLKAA